MFFCRSILPNSTFSPWANRRLVGKTAMVLIGFSAMLTVIGCTRNPYPPGYAINGQYPQAGAQPGYVGTLPQTATAPTVGPNSVFAQQQTNPQLLDLQRRVQQLDENNRQLTSQIAQAQQQSQAFQERAQLLAKQLQDATSQNQQLLATTQQYAQQARGMQASMSQLQTSMTARGGARLTANNSVNASTSGLQIAGARVVPDGDVIRIRVAADQLFAPGTAQPNPVGSSILDQVATALVRQYPRQRVAIEGHTDNAQVYGGGFSTPYQLAGAQAQAIMDHLVRRSGVPMQQLFVVAHGPNHPVSDNQTPAGRAENRRVEIVIYPETY